MVDAWATVQEATDTTGVSVTDARLVQAQHSVEMLCNRIYADTPNIRTRDLYWLKLAVAYQAAWEQGQYDLNTRMGTTSVQQDGVVATVESVTCSPRAKQALQKVSWMRSRTVHIRTAFETGTGLGRDPLRDSGDDDHLWQPMPGGGA